MKKRNITIALSALVITTISGHAKTHQGAVEASGGGIVANVQAPQLSMQEMKQQIIQKAVNDLGIAESTMAEMVTESQGLVFNQEAFANKMKKLRTYVDAYIASSSACLIAEESYKGKPSGMSIANQIEVDKCFRTAEESLPINDYIIVMMKGMLNEMNAIKEKVVDNSIKAKTLATQILSLKAAIQVMGE